jgi:hypothetical protein
VATSEQRLVHALLQVDLSRSCNHFRGGTKRCEYKTLSLRCAQSVRPVGPFDLNLVLRYKILIVIQFFGLPCQMGEDHNYVHQVHF